MRILGVDFGLRRIGLALSDETERLATPLRALAVSSIDEAPGAVAAAAREAGAEAVVVGAPLGLEGEEGRIEMRRAAATEPLHAAAAAVILQRWLDRPARRPKGDA
jgi:RNase H-fold protein (predicted Holliday junction resolvase)